MVNTVHDLLWAMVLAVLILVFIVFWPVLKFVLIGIGVLAVVVAFVLLWLFGGYLSRLDQHDREFMRELPEVWPDDQPAGPVEA